MQPKSRQQPNQLRRALPWIYGFVVMGSLLATSVWEVSAGGAICLGLNALLVGGFLVIGRHVGLWDSGVKASIAVSELRPCPNPPCREGIVS